MPVPKRNAQPRCMIASICITSLGVDLEKKTKKDAEEYAGVFERDRRISSRFL